MGAETADRHLTKTPPKWVVVLVILLTGGITAAAAWKSGLRGPEISWQNAQEAINQIWAPDGAQQAMTPAPTIATTPTQPIAPQATAPQAQAPVVAPSAQPDPNQSLATPQYSPAPGAAEAAASGGIPTAPAVEDQTATALAPSVPAPPSGARTVAGLPGVPAILNGSIRPHPDRGPCTKCHTVLEENGNIVPTIHSFSVMPHGYRGVCSNCHQVQVGMGLTGSPVAGLQVQPAPAVGALLQASWLGISVQQSGLGVVVLQVQGDAAALGIRQGDVISSVNGQSISSLQDFLGATSNGQLPQGALIIQRAGNRLAFELAPRTPSNLSGQPMTPNFNNNLGGGGF